MNLVIKNCNCINQADISIEPNCLNIKYAMNGTGKSTISKAILLKSQDEDALKEQLRPYGKDEESDEQPEVSDIPYTKVKVFNDSYVNTKVLSKENFFDNPYMIFLNTGECDDLENKIKEMLDDLQEAIQNVHNLDGLRNMFNSYFTIFKLKGDSIAKTGGVGELLKGNGSGFERYHELESYKPFYNNKNMKTVSTWAKWRRDGIDKIVEDQCPFCTKKLAPEMAKQNQVIEKVFKNSALSTANAVLEYLKNASESGFIDANAINEIENYIGDASKSSELCAALSRLGTETHYLNDKLNEISLFRPMNVTHEQLNKIEESLEILKIKKTMIDKYYCTPSIYELVDMIEIRVNTLKENTRKLKGLFEAHEKKLNQIVEHQKEDINEFLALAGFPYEFELAPDGEKKAKAYLKPSNEIIERIPTPSEHLSWGEKNAFSLVMFMFEALSENADLIVLDDPISSFDTNKKFAVIRRMFDNKKKSFRDKTVLLLTHDMQPIIDYIKGSFFSRMGLTTAVNAKWLYNANGHITETTIEESDLKNVVELTNKICMDSTYPMHVRIVNYRKYIELTKTNCGNVSSYQILSNLIHGRTTPMKKDGTTPIGLDITTNGCNQLREKLGDFTYDDLLSMISDEKLKDEIKNGNDYSKVMAFRLLFERHEDVFKSLRIKEPATYKYINETNHIENDYVFQLDPMKFYSIPTYYLQKLTEAISRI